MQTDGIILKGIGGFYYVEAADKVYECKAKGVFRREKIVPLPGDNVTISIGSNGDENTIDVIHKRRSVLNRPPVANIDRLFIVVAVCEPMPNALVTDRLTAIAVDKGIEPVVVVTKSDLGDSAEIEKIYLSAGIKTICTCAHTGENSQEVKDELRGHMSAFTGNTGVGKSTLLNLIDPALGLQTAEISRKLGRGRHTTRHVELFKVDGGYVADTPGFSSLDIENGEFIQKDNLQFCFPEFQKYIGKCRFTGCAHIRDKGCCILEAVENGEISRSRHASYEALYSEAKEIKDWQIK